MSKVVLSLTSPKFHSTVFQTFATKIYILLTKRNLRKKQYLKYRVSDAPKQTMNT